MEELLTVQQVAKILQTNVDYVYKLQRTGLLKFLKIGRLKCRRATLDAFIKQFEGFDISNPENIKSLEEGEADEC